MQKIGVVLVTFNRLDKLTQALNKFEQQTVAPAYVLVVDNASTDGTAAHLENWKQQPSAYEKIVVTSPVNSGGSGGFHLGLQEARKLDAQWIWLSDDDAFPEEDALEQAERFIDQRNTDRISAICGAVINNGVYDADHRRRIQVNGCRVEEPCCTQEDYEKPFFRLDCISYVGIVIHKPALEKAGLTEKDFFIWYDDTEHSIRLGKCGEMYCVPAIRVHHDIAPQAYTVTWKRYYGCRNRLVALKRHFAAKQFLYAAYWEARHAVKNLLRGGVQAQEGMMVLCAVKDAAFERLGIHKKYRPGWKPN